MNQWVLLECGFYCRADFNTATMVFIDDLKKFQMDNSKFWILVVSSTALRLPGSHKNNLRNLCFFGIIKLFNSSHFFNGFNSRDGQKCCTSFRMLSTTYQLGTLYQSNVIHFYWVQFRVSVKYFLENFLEDVRYFFGSLTL